MLFVAFTWSSLSVGLHFEALEAFRTFRELGGRRGEPAELLGLVNG